MKTSVLVSKVRRGMSLPNVENRFSDAALLDLANDELQSSILPWLFSLREDYLVTQEDRELSSIEKGRIRFPSFASGRTLKDLWVSQTGSSWRPLKRVGLNDSWGLSENERGIPSSFWLQGDEIFFYPRPGPTETGFLRVFYHTLPNQLVSEQRGLKIASVSADDTVTVSSVPSFFAVGESLDAIFATPDYQVLARGLTVASKTNNSITFAGFDSTNTLLEAGIQAGQILCLNGETIVTPIPTEVNQLLIQSVIVRVLESMNAPQQLSLALERFNRLKIQLRDILTPRSENRLLKMRPQYPFLRGRRIL